MGTLRALLAETMALRQEEARWVVTADMATMMGFDTRRAQGTSDVIGYEVKGVWAPFQALKDMDAKHLSVMLRKPVPPGVTANDMLEVLKTMRLKQTDSGVTLVPEPGLQQQVAQNAAALAARRYRGKGVDLVVTPQSSSQFAATFGAVLATLIGAKHVEEGTVKSNNIRLELPQHVRSTKTGQDAEKALERWKKKLAAGETPSLRSTFKPSIRQHVKGFMDVGNSMVDHVGEPKKVLIADDVVTTGSTHLDSKRALEEMGFEVVGMVAAFKEQSTR